MDRDRAERSTEGRPAGGGCRPPVVGTGSARRPWAMGPTTKTLSRPEASPDGWSALPAGPGFLPGGVDAAFGDRPGHPTKAGARVLRLQELGRRCPSSSPGPSKRWGRCWRVKTSRLLPVGGTRPVAVSLKPRRIHAGPPGRSQPVRHQLLLCGLPDEEGHHETPRGWR